MSQQAAAALSKLLGNIAKYSVALGVAGGALQASMYTGEEFWITGNVGRGAFEHMDLISKKRL